ncbi:hypothetical protein V2J09_007134 [Rumex salicifolius]
MADLNSNFSSPPLESDDISVLVHTLLRSSNSPSSVPLDASQHLDYQQRPPAPEIQRTAFFNSSSGINFRYHGDCYAADDNELFRSAFSSAILSSAEGIDELDCESEDKDASEMPRGSGPLRRSSKRTRPAEIHNISEKRRRERINEKMKALQKLIPNSNKTDRASMLDDAIEYLKQLQLQVQQWKLAIQSGLFLWNIPTAITDMPSMETKNLVSVPVLAVEEELY